MVGMSILLSFLAAGPEILGAVSRLYDPFTKSVIAVCFLRFERVPGQCEQPASKSHSGSDMRRTHTIALALRKFLSLVAHLMQFSRL